MDKDTRQEIEQQTGGCKWQLCLGPYKWVARCFALGLMKPVAATERRRLALIVLEFSAVSPILFMLMWNMFDRLLRRELFNVIQHSTIAGPFLAVFVKQLLMYYKRAPMAALLDELERDTARLAARGPRYRALAAASERHAVFSFERVWAFMVFVVTTLFPIQALVWTTFSYIFEETPQRYMVHVMDIPFTKPGTSFESPYFEIIYVYSVYCTILLLLNFTGFDGMFGIMTNHSCLKMKVYCLLLQDAFKIKNPEKMHNAVLHFLEEQRRSFRFHKLIQDVYNFWLGLILFSTMIQVGSLLYHITADSHGLDPRYAVFSFASVFHFYVPCQNAANVKKMSTDTADLMCAGAWQEARSVRVRRALPLLVARAQQPQRFLALGLFAYDMDLFVMIMRTSYSLFTLMKSN